MMMKFNNSVQINKIKTIDYLINFPYADILQFIIKITIYKFNNLLNFNNKYNNLLNFNNKFNNRNFINN